MPGNRGGRGGRGGKGGSKDTRSGGWIQPKSDTDVLSGPGVMITCVKNKERSAIAEAEKIFSEVAHELYPDLDVIQTEEAPVEEEEMDIEEELAADLAKERNFKKETPRHFMSCQTDAMCIIYVNFRPPIDPVRVVEHIFTKIEATGVMNFAYCLRLTPISATCRADMESVSKLAKRLFPPHFDNEEHQEPKTYRIETKGRYNDESLNRNNVITFIPKLVPGNQGHKVSFDKTDKVIVIETYKNASGMSILENFDRFKKYNLRETQAKFHKAKDQEKAKASGTSKAANLIPTSDPKSKHFGHHYMENAEVKAGAEALLTDILAGKGEEAMEKKAVAAATFAADAEVVIEVAAEDSAAKETTKRSAAADVEPETSDNSSKKLRLI